MRHEQATDEMIEKAALYALGSLSQHEAKAFELHLAEGCQACSAELAQFAEVAGLIGVGVSEAEPPARLRNMLIDRIQREPLAGPAPAFRIDQRQEFRAEVKPRKSGFSTILPWAVAASVAALAGVSLLMWRTADQRIAVFQEEVQKSEQRTAQAQAEASQIKELLSEERAVIRALESPGSVKVLMAGQAPAPDSDTATVYWDKQDQQWVVTASLAPAPAGKVYQLWFVAAGGPRSAGLIKTDRDGHGFLLTNVPPDVGQIGAAAITLEPSGGSASPTMPILVIGKTS